MAKHKHGGDVYSQKYIADYSANINPLGPPPGVLKAVQESAGRIANYPDVEHRELKKTLANKTGTEPEQLIFGNGAAELIFALALGLKPKKALLAAPGFAEYEEALLAAGCQVEYYLLRGDKDFVIQADYLEYISSDVDMLFLCNPNNPTGSLTDRKLLLQIAEKCTQCRVTMVVDECFNGFLDEPREYTLKDWTGRYPSLFLLNAFTKIYAMPGLRLGYGICSDPQVLEKMRRVMQPWSVSLPAQRAGVAALSEDVYVQTARALISEEKQYLTGELKNMGCSVWRPAANYIFFKGPLGLAEACQRKGYLIRDCGNYRNLCAGYYRIAVRTREENAAFAAALREIIWEAGSETEEKADGKSNYDTGNHVQCGKEPDRSRAV